MQTREAARQGRAGQSGRRKNEYKLVKASAKKSLPISSGKERERKVFANSQVENNCIFL